MSDASARISIYRSSSLQSAFSILGKESTKKQGIERDFIIVLYV
jgi:hypothetical protein